MSKKALESVQPPFLIKIYIIKPVLKRYFLNLSNILNKILVFFNPVPWNTRILWDINSHFMKNGIDGQIIW